MAVPVVTASLTSHIPGEQTVVAVTVDFPPEPVLGGYYLSGGQDITADIAGSNVRSHTTYRSLADGYVFPGWNRQWLATLGTAGVAMNVVLELKHYGAGIAGAQSFAAGGPAWSVPAPAMTIQQRPGTKWPRAYGYGQVLSGQCDGLLARAGSQLKELPFPVNIQVASELDTDHEFGTTEAGKAYDWAASDARAVAAVGYVVDWLRDYGVPAGTTFSVGVGGFDRACFKRTHPESLMARLDFLQWNVYATSATHTAVDRFRRARDWAVADLGPIGRSRPVIVAEWGVRAAEIPDQAAWIASVPKAVEAIHATPGPRIVRMNYFNSGWGTLSPKSTGLAALRAAYASSPYV